MAHEAIEELPERCSAQQIERARERFDDAAAEHDRLERNLLDAYDAEHDMEARAGLRPAVRVGREALTYRPDTPEVSFFRDAFAMRSQDDFAARERLERNSREQAEVLRGAFPGVQFRDVGTSAFAGLVVPQYLVDLVAPLARAGSPLVNALVSKLPLPPEGLTVNVSRITTGAGVAAQATENAAVQETDVDDTLLTVNVRTYAGMQDVSRQALERGTAIDRVIYSDLVRAYFTALDSALINADGTSGAHLGIRSTAGIVSVAYTDASPTVPELYPKLAAAIQQINANLFSPASVIVMHPRRWAWETAALDSSNRPLLVPNANGPFNAIAVGDAAGYGQVVGVQHSLPVITDGNIPTNLGAGANEDVILVLSNPELVLWHEGDGMPRQLRFEQTATAPATIRLAVWGYSAFTAGRYPAASAVIGGTGLVPPTF